MFYVLDLLRSKPNEVAYWWGDAAGTARTQDMRDARQFGMSEVAARAAQMNNGATALAVPAALLDRLSVQTVPLDAFAIMARVQREM